MFLWILNKKEMQWISLGQ